LHHAFVKGVTKKHIFVSKKSLLQKRLLRSLHFTAENVAMYGFLYLLLFYGGRGRIGPTKILPAWLVINLIGKCLTRTEHRLCFCKFFILFSFKICDFCSKYQLMSLCIAYINLSTNIFQILKRKFKILCVYFLILYSAMLDLSPL
jgi:hypothetical protein